MCRSFFVSVDVQQGDIWLIVYVIERHDTDPTVWTLISWMLEEHTHIGKVIFMVRSKTQRNDADQQNKVSRQSNYFTKFEAFMIIFFAACVDKYEEADEAS